MIHPNVTRQFFTMLSCKNVGGDDDSSANVVLGNMLEKCYSSQHIFFIVTLGMPMLILWVLDIPFFAWFVLFRNRDLVIMSSQGASTVMRNQKKVFESQMAFLYRGYKPTRYYWFLNEMARKAILVAIAVFFPGALHTQLLLASLFIFLSILLQIFMKPFENKVTEIAELLSLFMSFMVFFLANFLFVDTVSETAKTVITVLICMLVVIFITAVVLAFIVLQKQEAKLVPLRNALREAHAKGMEAEPVIREWRIAMVRERRRAEQTKRNGAATIDVNDHNNVNNELINMPSADGSESRSRTARSADLNMFVTAPTSTAPASTLAKSVEMLREHALESIGGNSANAGLQFGGGHDKSSEEMHNMQSSEILTNAQRGAALAGALDVGRDISTGLLSSSAAALQLSTEDVAQWLIEDARRQVGHAHMLGESRDLDLALQPDLPE